MRNPMLRSLFSNKYTFIAILIIIAGCAKISAPSGGPKDKEPPVVVKSVPVNSAKNFKGKKFSITFNEFVTLEKINEKFMVSPPLKKKPRVYLKGKTVNVEYEDDLRDSTTYTFNFQDAIHDLNEGNILNNYQFVFSTGSVIDSLSVTGNVYNALSLDPPEETLVLLYSELYDSAVVKHLPAYISKAGKDGYFRIDNIKEGIYRLYALKDADNSKNFNLPDEQIAFMDAPIEVTSQKSYLPVRKDTVKTIKAAAKTADTVLMQGDYKLILFQPMKTAYYLTSSSRNPAYKLTYALSRPPESGGFDFSIPGTGKNSYYIERNRDNDSITVWLTDSALYARPLISTLLRYPFTDTTGKVIQKSDTILLRFLSPRATRGKAKPTPFLVTSTLFNGSQKPGHQFILQAQTPFRAPDTSKIRIYETSSAARIKVPSQPSDTSKIRTNETLSARKIRVPFTLVRDTVNSCRMILSTRLIQGKNYLFIANSAAFGDIYGKQSDSVGYKVTLRNDETYGKLTMNITNYKGDRIIQLLTSTDKLVSEVRMSKDGKIEFPYIERGRYRLRVIYDLNGDGKWTTGNFNKGLQPEPASFYPQEIEVKENWEYNQDWDISSQNMKKFNSPAAKNSGRQY